MTETSAEHLPFQLYIQCKMCGVEFVCTNPSASIDVVEDGVGGSGYLVLIGMPIRCPSCCMPYLRGVDSVSEVGDDDANEGGTDGGAGAG